MKFFIKDFFSKCDQIRRILRIGSHLLKKSLLENFIFCAIVGIVWFPSFHSILRTSPYSVQMRENTDQKTPNTDTFHAVLLTQERFRSLFQRPYTHDLNERSTEITLCVHHSRGKPSRHLLVPSQQRKHQHQNNI